AWLASGDHPSLAGVAIPLLGRAYRPDRRGVDHAREMACIFGQSPNGDYARRAANSLRESICVDERLQSAYYPYLPSVVLPLFALANAGVALDAEILEDAVGSPIMWAVVAGLVAGKALGILGTSGLLWKLRIGDFGPGLSLDRLAGGAVLSGIGFTISLFIVDLAIEDPAVQNEARVGVLVASVVSFIAAAVIFRYSDASHPEGEAGMTLARPVDPARDHMWGRPDAPLTLVEYGDYQCPFCLKVSGAIEEVKEELGDRLRYVWRHAPLEREHPNAVAAAEAVEAAADRKSTRLNSSHVK